MPGAAAFLYSVQHDFNPALIVFGIVMFGAWTVAYGQIVLHSFRDRTYGLPLPSICLNIGWEFLYSFNIVAPGVVALVWGNRLWFVVDLVIVATVFKFGRDRQTNPWIRKHFYPLIIASIAASAVGLYCFATYFNDIYGLAASFLMNFAMSVLFIAMLFKRPDLKGLPYGAAWAKMIGTLAGAAFCYVWWPRQFDAGTLVRPPYITQPSNSNLLYFLYVTIPIIDGIYIYLHRQRQKALAVEHAQTAAATGSAYQLTVT